MGWGLVLGSIAWAAFPQHKAVILGVGFAVTAAKALKCRKGEEDAPNGSASEASLNAVTLEWRNVRCTVTDKKSGSKKDILKGVSGKAKPGRLMAIMGPSGSGKTTLLNALAGQLPKSNKTKLTGTLLMNGKDGRRAQKLHRLAYVRQDDIFYSQLTVRETLHMAARLQMARSTPDSEKDEYVEELLQKLGLVRCADTIVGDEKTRGISGGEKKRLSIACELIASPSVIFADEPTTGLDAFQAEQVMEALNGLASAGHTVVASIHQPRGSIFDKFDDLLLMAEGEVVYDGPAQAAIGYFETQGFKMPAHENPAEFFADLISVDHSSPELEEETVQRLTTLVDAFKTQTGPIENDALSPTTPGNKVKTTFKRLPRAEGSERSSFVQQFRLLLLRAWRQVTRDKLTNFVRGAMNITSALIFGSIYWQIGLKQVHIQDRMGLLQVSAINTAMAALTKTLNVFPNERDIVQRERTKGQYSVATYFISKLTAELPVIALFPLAFCAILYPMAGLHKSTTRFLQFMGIVTLESFSSGALGLAVGGFSPSPEAALALGPMVMLFFIIFGGYYINPDSAPSVFRWLPKVSLIKIGFEGMSVNEFKGLKFEASKPGDMPSGDVVLERLSFKDSTVRSSCLKQARLMLFYYLLTYTILKENKPQYQEMEPPSTAVAEDGEAAV